MVKKCKCHGLSGSCNLKTCWKKMADFSTVGDRLKDGFDGAIKVIGSNDGEELLPSGDTIKPHNSKDLIYGEDSPNFCCANRRAGSLGTSGRDCDPNSIGVGGCDILCCGRGYRKYQQTVKENCRCVFKWCCEVKCDICTVTKTIYKCV
jgi:wingless-type MMTV integration site family protein 6